MVEETTNKNYYNAVSFLENKHEEIMDNLLKLERISWEIESMVINEPVLKELKELNQTLFDELTKCFAVEEEVLFPEIEHMLPEQDTVTVMKNEHNSVLTLSKSILEMLNHKNIEAVKDKIQSSMISLVDILQRLIHKKNEILYYTILPRETLDDIYYKMRLKFGE